MKIRQVVTAFISHNNKWLLMKRADNSKIAPGYWHGVGGHIEDGEFCEPERAIRREIFEESGLSEQDISQLRLRLIVLRRNGQETVLNYVYTASSHTDSIVSSSEGKLFWVERNEVQYKKFADVIRLIVDRIIFTEDQEDLAEVPVYVGTMLGQDPPLICWHELTDYPGLI